mmetsp:Transcript_99738/g.320063  ORF Transcript_99738/g.320063 Transcript_99738/m.320063 type:complete len:201 (+) Transcript_99738:1294-1896(+)
MHARAGHENRQHGAESGSCSNEERMPVEDLPERQCKVLPVRIAVQWGPRHGSDGLHRDCIDVVRMFRQCSTKLLHELKGIQPEGLSQPAEEHTFRRRNDHLDSQIVLLRALLQQLEAQMPTAEAGPPRGQLSDGLQKGVFNFPVAAVDVRCSDLNFEARDGGEIWVTFGRLHRFFTADNVKISDNYPDLLCLHILGMLCK